MRAASSTYAPPARAIEWIGSPAVASQGSDALWGRAPLTAGCSEVYLDMGLNRGYNFRHLYEPEAPRHRRRQAAFVTAFGAGSSTSAARERVCAIGFEPNPNHTQTLRRTIAGFAPPRRAYAFVAALASNSSASAPLYTDGDMRRAEWAASLVVDNPTLAKRDGLVT